MISRIEKQLKRRFAIGSQVSEHSIVQDFTKQVSVRRDYVLLSEYNQAAETMFVASLKQAAKTLNRLLSLSDFAEVSRARHLQSPPPDAEEGRAPAPHAEEGALQSQIEQTPL